MSKRFYLPITILLATLVVWLMPAMTAAQSAPSNAQWGEITGDNVRIRTGGSTQFRALTTASRGERFVIVGQRSGWAELQANHEFESYVHSNLVDVASDGKTGVINGSSVVVRLRPSTDSFRLTTVSRGTTVEIVGRSGEFFQIIPPVGVSVWVSAEFIRAIGPVSAAEFEAYRTGGDIESHHAGSQSPASSSEASSERSNDRVRQAEEQLLQDLDGRFESKMAEAAAGQPSDDLIANLRRLAHEFEAFADACQSPEILDEAQGRARQLRAVREELVAARAGDVEEEERVEEAEPREANPAPQANDADRQRALDRLLYKPREEFVAVGEVADARDSEGRRVYILVHEGQVLYRIELAPEAREVDLRSLWHRTVAVRGRIVKVQGEQYPRIVCTEIVPK